MRFNQSSACNYCGYDANSSTATQCENCNQPLLRSAKRVNRKNFPKLRLAKRWGVSLAVLLLVGSGLYVLWKTYARPLLSSGSASQLNLAPTYRLYDSMKDVQNVPNGLFNYGGSIIFATLTAQGMNAAILKAHPRFQLSFTDPVNGSPGSGTGIKMLIDKQLSFSQSSRPLKDAELAKAANRGFRLEAVPVALDGIAFYTHSKLSLKGLSIHQVQAIFTDKITNWKEVGGPDLPIVPISVETKANSSFQILFQGKFCFKAKRTLDLVLRFVFFATIPLAFVRLRQRLAQSLTVPLPQLLVNAAFVQLRSLRVMLSNISFPS